MEPRASPQLGLPGAVRGAPPYSRPAEWSALKQQSVPGRPHIRANSSTRRTGPWPSSIGLSQGLPMEYGVTMKKHLPVVANDTVLWTTHSCALLCPWHGQAPF